MSTAIDELVVSTGILDCLRSPWDAGGTGDSYSSIKPDCYRLVKLVAEECSKICGNGSISAKIIREKFGLI